MPDTITTPEIKVHPDFCNYSENGRNVSYLTSNHGRTSEVWDFSISKDEMFLIPTSYKILAFASDGLKYAHYKNDDSLIKVQSGASRYTYTYFRDKASAEAIGYKFSFRMQSYMKEDHPDFYGHETMLNYHSSARTDYSLDGDTWKVGCEVEKEDSRYQNNTSVWKLFAETGWAKERDGSLGQGGFELVSPILPLFDRKRLKAHLSTVKQYLNAQHSQACGGHINLSCKGKRSKEVLASLKAGAALLYAIYEPRMTNRYCPARQWNRYESMPDKYSAFYLKNDQVCEIRLFPAVKSLKNLMWRLDLVRWLVSINEKDFVKKILSLQNRNSYLSCHLRQVYTEDKIRNIAQRAIKHYQKWIAPLTVSEKEKFEAAGYVVDPNRIVADGTEMA